VDTRATDKHRRILEGLLPAIGGRANLVPDAHLAALASNTGLCSAPPIGFHRFPGLRWEDPLAS